MLTAAYQSEMLDSFDEKSSSDVSPIVSEHEHDIGFGKSEFYWSNDTGISSPSQPSFRLHFKDDVVFTKGGFNIICGPTGSGKTSILMALLGEMHHVPLGPQAWVGLPRKGGVAYAAQESWVLSDTIKVRHV